VFLFFIYRWRATATLLLLQLLVTVYVIQMPNDSMRIVYHGHICTRKGKEGVPVWIPHDLFLYNISAGGGRHYPAIYLRNNLIMNIIYPPDDNSCLRHCAYSVITIIIILYCIIIIVITIVLMRIERTSCIAIVDSGILFIFLH